MFKSSWIFLVIFFLAVSGCARLTEYGKVILGTSTQRLEEARVEALSQKYVCSFDECFDAILSLGHNEELYTPNTEKFFTVFLKDRIRSHVVVMGVIGQVETTEVGIFLTRESDGVHIIEISSLSTRAKEKVADAVFAELNTRFLGKN